MNGKDKHNMGLVVVLWEILGCLIVFCIICTLLYMAVYTLILSIPQVLKALKNIMKEWEKDE